MRITGPDTRNRKSYLHSGNLNLAQADWTLPAVAGNSNYPNWWDAPDTSFRAGLGNNSLVQAGADSIASATPTYKFCDEDYPNNTRWISSIAPRPGDLLYVSSTYNSNGTAEYFFEDETTGQWTDDPNQSAPHYDGSSADFISERLGPYGLPQFTTNPAFHSCVAGDSTTFYNLQSSNNDLWIMTTNGQKTGTVRSQPGSVNNKPRWFSVTWEHS